MGYFGSAPPRVLAHRGFTRPIEGGPPALENTAPAFEGARALGVDHLETDVRVTADAAAVLWHDRRLYRYDGSPTPIAALPLRALEDRAGARPRILTLAEALERFPDASFNVDVKDEGAAPAVVAAVREAHAEDRVLLVSASERTCARLRRGAPGAWHGTSQPRAIAAVAAIAAASRPALERILSPCDVVQLPWTALGAGRRLRARVHALGEHCREVHAWTVNHPQEMRALLEAGVDGIITDRSDLALALLRERHRG